MDPVRARVHVLAEGIAGCLELFVRDIGIKIPVVRRPHAMVLPVGDELVALLWIGLLSIPYDRNTIKVVDHTDLLAVLIESRQAKPAASQFKATKVGPVRIESV